MIVRESGFRIGLRYAASSRAASRQAAGTPHFTASPKGHASSRHSQLTGALLPRWLTAARL